MFLIPATGIIIHADVSLSLSVESTGDMGGEIGPAELSGGTC